jgi:SAM-dependent methyltransferase
MNKIDTLQYYNNNAMEFVSGTEFADVSVLREKFLNKIPVGGMILDWGSGSGRDTGAFIAAGYQVEAVDACEELARYASNKTGIEVRVERFDELDAKNKYDGIWACASILHVEKERIPEMLGRMRDALKPGGVMYISFKYGDFSGLRDGRYFVDLNEELFGEILKDISGVKIIDEWVSVDVRRGKDVTWLNELVVREG